MDPYRDANAPPPYAYDGPPLPPYTPPHGEKFQGAAPYQGPPHAPYAQPGPPYGQHGGQYAPHAQAYAPLPPTPQVIINPQPQSVVVRAITVGREPIRTECPSCHTNVKSRIIRNNTMKTHLTAILLCLICCWPCICVPYCMASCKDTTHLCPKCKAFLGTYRA